jgi:FlaA1/EpsC-like NDP-sugar epimerase
MAQTMKASSPKEHLEQELKIHNRIIAFIDDDNNKSKKHVDGTPVYHSSELLFLLQNEQVDEMIIATQTFRLKKK